MKREFSGIPGIPTGIPIGFLDMGMTTEIRVKNKINMKVIQPIFDREITKCLVLRHVFLLLLLFFFFLLVES